MVDFSPPEFASSVNDLLRPLCYLRGTQILTSSGEVPVEELTIGSSVVTASGAVRPIKWIGRRGYVTGLVSPQMRDNVLPIRIALGSLGLALPRRDLYVSPEHSICLDDVLIPARHLVNGTSIAYCDHFAKIEYFHIELETHDIIYAEGVASESWLDCNNRNMFSNVLDYFELNLPQADAPARPCLPFVTEGPMLDAVRTKLVAHIEQSGFALSTDPNLRLVADDVVTHGECSTENVYTFKLQACPRRMAILSRVSVPSDIVAGSIDRRNLGVNVKRITFKTKHVAIEAMFDDPSLSVGFWEAEPAHRWTSGFAIIPEHFLQCLTGPVTVEVHLARRGLPYATRADADEHIILMPATWRRPDVPVVLAA